MHSFGFGVGPSMSIAEGLFDTNTCVCFVRFEVRDLLDVVARNPTHAYMARGVGVSLHGAVNSVPVFCMSPRFHGASPCSSLSSPYAPRCSQKLQDAHIRSKMLPRRPMAAQDAARQPKTLQDAAMVSFGPPKRIIFPKDIPCVHMLRSKSTGS